MTEQISKIGKETPQKMRLTPDGLLPPALPIVLYNGQEPWWAPLEMDALVDTSIPELADFRLRMSYRVFDEIHLSPEELPKGPVAAIFQIERSRDPEELGESLRNLIEELEDTDLVSLKLDIATWVRRIIQPKRFHDHPVDLPEELGDLKDMLAERVKEWEKELMAEGKRKGERIAFLKLLRSKFGAVVADSLAPTVDRADSRDIECWLERILDAESPDEIFDRAEAVAT